MEMLDLGRINAIAPYSVAFYDDSYHFETAGGIHIAIEFEPEHNFQYNGYWLGLLNLDRRPSLRDEKLFPKLIPSMMISSAILMM